MNRFSEKKNKQFDEGFLGEKNFEISFRNLRTPSLKLQLDMHHLGLNKQSSYVGQRNLKYFNSIMTLKDQNTGRKLTANISPYSTQNYEFVLEQPIQNNQNNNNQLQLQSKWKCALTGGITKVCQNEITQLHHKNYNIGGYIKGQNFHNQNQLNFYEDGNYGVECSLRFFNYSKKNDLNQFQININNNNNNNIVLEQSSQENNNVIEESSQNNEEIVIKINQNNQQKQQQLSKKQQQQQQLKYELCFNLKTIKFDEIQTKIYADLIFRKFEGIFSINLTNKNIKGMLLMLRYNSSVWLRVSQQSNDKKNNNIIEFNNSIQNETNKNNQVGVELVYQHSFNKYIHLKNYINSNYTIATQLSYHPSDFATLIYSATVNIQKFKQDIEDYKVGYGIHFNF